MDSLSLYHCGGCHAPASSGVPQGTVLDPLLFIQSTLSETGGFFSFMGELSVESYVWYESRSINEINYSCKKY